MDQFNYFLKLGVWKLAEELLVKIELVDSNLKNDIGEFLWDLATKCKNSKYFQNDLLVLNAWEQCWLAASVLYRFQTALENKSSITDVLALRKEVEFKHILSKVLNPNLDPIVFEELTLLYGHVIQAKKVKFPVQKLTTDCHNFLCDSFLNNSTTTNIVAQKLLCLWCNHFEGTDIEIQGIYKEVLWQCIQKLENQDSNSYYSSSNCLLCIISILQILEEKQDSLLEWLCPRLIYLFELGMLPRQLIYLSFVSRENPKWLHVLNNVEDDRYDRIIDNTQDLTSLERTCSRLVSIDGSMNIEEMFMRSMKTRDHFIEDIVSLCSNLLAFDGGKEMVHCLMSHHMLENLLPVLILHTWSNFANRENIFSTLCWLIDALKSVVTDSTFICLGHVLEQHIHLVKWCKKNSNGQLTSNSELLNFANQHSSLELMRRTTHLADANWEQVKQMLQHEQTGSANKTSEVGTSNQWDVITFDGFCIMTTLFKTILAATELQASLILEHPSYNPGAQQAESIYNLKVTKRLESIKYRVCRLYPLHFRVEMLENIFSLLFLRYEDLKEENLSDSAGEDDEAERVRSPEIDESVFESWTNTPSSKLSSKCLNSQATSNPTTTISKTNFVTELQVSPSPSLELEQCFTTQPITVPQLSSTHQKSKQNFNWSWPQSKIAPTKLSKKSSLPVNVVSGEVSAMSHSVTVSGLNSTPDTINSVQHNLAHGLVQSSPIFLKTTYNFPNSPQPSIIGPISPKFPDDVQSHKYSNATASMKSGLLEIGFICNEPLVRDVLSCLKDCLVDTSAAYYSSLSQKNEVAYCQVPSSISTETVQFRLNRLSQYVSVATWRLQLFTSYDFIKQVGNIASGLGNYKKTPNWYYFDEESDNGSEEEEKIEAREQELSKTRKTPKRKKSETEKSSDTGSLSNTTGCGSISGSSSRRMEKSKNKRRQSSVLPVSSTIINLMLSSPSSLVVQCLTLGDFDKAHQVIQMCRMDDSSLATEVKFIIAYQCLCQNLQAQDSKGGLEKMSLTKKEKSAGRNSTLQAIRQAATAGVQSTAFISHVENFLSTTELPTIFNSTTVMKDFPRSQNMLQGANCRSSLTAIDIALTLGSTNKHSVSLLEVASKYCSSLQDELKCSTSPMIGKMRNKQPVGFIRFTQLMIQVLKGVNQDLKEGNNIHLFSKNISISNILASEKFPLDPKEFDKLVLFWDSLYSSVNEFELTLMDETNKCKHLIATPTKNIHNKLTHITFRKVLKVIHSIGSMKSDGQDDIARDCNYATTLYNYLKLLSTLVIQNLPSEKGLLCPSTYFEVMEQSLVSLIGHLVFECDIPPSRLETVAYRMNLDLVYKVVQNCCPKIPATSSFCPLFNHGIAGTSWGQIALNRGKVQWAGQVRHPEVAVRSLLSDLLELISQQQNYESTSFSINVSGTSSLASNSLIQSFLIETQELSEVDLTLLHKGNEALTFFTNLANLMWIHSLLFLEATIHSTCSKEKPNNCIYKLGDRFDLMSDSSLQRYLSQTCLGYNIGQLGFLSLHELHKELLGKEIYTHSEPVAKLFASSQLYCNLDIWEVLTVSKDPRVLFALTNGKMGSPKVEVLFVDNIDLQLNKLMLEYINFSVKINGNDLIVPEQLSWYLDHLMANNLNNTDAQEADDSLLCAGLLYDNELPTVSYKDNNTRLVINFIRDNSSGQLQADLVRFDKNKQEMTLIINQPDITFGITLEYFNDAVKDDISGLVTASAENWSSHSVREVVIQFLECHCWLLSILITRIHDLEVPHNAMTLSRTTDKRIQCLEHLLLSDTVTAWTSIYSSNPVVGALHIQPNLRNLWERLESLIAISDWLGCFQVFVKLPERLMSSDLKLQALNDLVMNNLASTLASPDNPKPWEYCQHIGNILQHVSCIVRNLKHWPASGCMKALRVLLDNTKRSLSKDMKSKLKLKICEIQMYSKILNCCDCLDLKTWYEVKCVSQRNPVLILKHLIEAKESRLCLEWIELHHIATRAQQLIDSRLLLLLLETEPPDFVSTTKILHSLVTIQAMALCGDLIHHLKSISSLTFIVDFLLGSCLPVLSVDDLIRYQHLSLGIQMLNILPINEQSQYLELIFQPRLIVEQFVMNTRLDILEKMLTAVQTTIAQLPISSPVSVNSIDALLRQYAAKALDFRVIQVQSTSGQFTNDEKLLVSFSTGSNSSQDFVMPLNVPTKDQWVPNDQVTECMCCDAVAFSMFNRRHHCRRCGRVICWSCSRQRRKIMGYNDVLVRVCDTCVNGAHSSLPGCDQTSIESVKENESTSLQGSFNSFARDLPWRLTSVDSHNKTVREEFGFEHAPSVSLCLAILKLHSEQTAYPRFLLDSCDSMLQLLQPVSPGTLNPEVDHSLIIHMVRALIVAAKVKYARSGLNTGVAHCDQLLSQADLLSELVRSDCSSLIPGEALSGHALRKLRDRLVEEELWSLAIDVSTKGGLERIGVWAAWGKVSLRSGRWDEARQKFSHCLDKVSSNFDSPRPVRSPPLLTEIIQILETGTYIVDRKVLQQADKIRASHDSKLTVVASPALTILHTLASLKNISLGKYPQTSSPSNIIIIGPKLDPLFYEECQYYLKTYGSHQGILTFYLNHDDLIATLKYILAQKVDPGIFYEYVYMPCLRRGLITNLHQSLEAMDSTLALWKVYLLNTCRHLERFGFLNVLYQLQLYMKDYIRAAMTCIKFYRAGAKNYSNLASNLDHLYKAHSHLEAELATQWGSTSHHSNIAGHRLSTSSTSSLLPMNLDRREVDRHINTILRQIEVTKFLSTCETEQRPVLQLIPDLFKILSATGEDSTSVPTLFGSNIDRVQLTVLVILCGKNVEEGFGTAFRIIQDYHLKASQVYSLAGKKLSIENRLLDVQQLIRCIQSSGLPDTNLVCDEVLILCVRVRAESSDPGNVEPLIKLISDTGNKISAYIECRQLKSAYLLAVKYERLGDVRRILREAERLGQSSIRKICAKRLSQHTSS